MSGQNTRALNNGVHILEVDLGVFQTEDGGQTVNAVRRAVEAGYRRMPI